MYVCMYVCMYQAIGRRHYIYTLNFDTNSEIYRALVVRRRQARKIPPGGKHHAWRNSNSFCSRTTWFPHAVKNSVKSDVSIYDLVTFWHKATDGSLSALDEYICMGPHTMYVSFTIQRMRLSPYSVWASPHTMYVWRRIQCTYQIVTQRTLLAKNSWKKRTVHTVREI